MTKLLLVPFLLAGSLLAGCGGSSQSGAPATTTPTATKPTPTRPAPTQPTTTSSPSALQAEATSAAAGDIPDNQVFLVFRNTKAGYSLKYPEGWAQQGAGPKVVFRDKNNVVRVVVARGAAPSATAVRRDVLGLPGARRLTGPQSMTIGGAPAFKVVYSTDSATNPVTGKRVTLVVDRYYLSHSGKEAIVDLGTPQGVDNVDAYRLMIESFRWR